jgi:hypothetical protein
LPLPAFRLAKQGQLQFRNSFATSDTRLSDAGIILFVSSEVRLDYFFAARTFAQRAFWASAIRLRPAADILRRALRGLPTTVSIDTVLTPPSISMTRSIKAISFRISAMMLSLLNAVSPSQGAIKKDSTRINPANRRADEDTKTDN